MGDRELLLEAFATSIHAKARALANATISPIGRARLREAISDDIKKYSNFVRPEVSRAACDEATRLAVDLYEVGWHAQTRFDAKRAVFHWEHVWPVSAVRAACLEAPSVAAVAEVLRKMLRVAWILKEEDRALTKLGYRTRRKDPDAAYRHAQIHLVPRGSTS